MSLPADQRPVDPTPIHTADLPPLPTRDRTIPAEAWVEAPEALLRLGDDLPGRPPAGYKREINGWLLWRAGPARRGDARYLALRRDDPATQVVFTLRPDGTGAGLGPQGDEHDRFRSWKEALRDFPLSP